MSKRLITAAFLAFLTGPATAGDLPEPVQSGMFPSPRAESVLLGRDLFFDPVLSGNRNISCGTCHHPALASGDGMSLSIGEGGTGLGAGRVPDPADQTQARIPRNAPALFNLGAADFTTLFYDGRVAHDPDAAFRIRMPAGFALERPVRGPLAAQALLPVVARDEMAGQPGENAIADAVAEGRIQGPDGAWQRLARRVAAVPEYRRRFAWLRGRDATLHITEIGNAIADFIAFEFRATDSPFDAFLHGDDAALSNDQLRGMALFYGKAGCATCHSGPFQTDHAFHAIGLPPLGPGKAHGPNGYTDHGRAAITGRPEDLYRFRTPSLRNVTRTAPYGHNGAYARLEDIVRHHLDPLTWLAEYTPDKALLSGMALSRKDTAALEDFDEMLRIAMAVEIEPVPLSESEMQAILAFLAALEDTRDIQARLGVPAAVPSGLPLDPLPQGETASAQAASRF